MEIEKSLEIGIDKFSVFVQAAQSHPNDFYDHMLKYFRKESDFRTSQLEASKAYKLFKKLRKDSPICPIKMDLDAIYCFSFSNYYPLCEFNPKNVATLIKFTRNNPFLKEHSRSGYSFPI